MSGTVVSMKSIYVISLVGLFSIFPYIAGDADDVRLVDGQYPHEGRVEVYYYGRWGTVCDDHWSLNEAQVVCRQLGYIGADLALVAAAYGRGNGSIWLDDVECEGDEWSIHECDHNTVGTHDCSHDDDASVACTTRGSLRLDDGVLQILENSSNSWGSVCGDSWTPSAGEVACRQLGFSGYLDSSVTSYHNAVNSGDDETREFLSGFRCQGNETRLEACPDAVWNTTNTCGEREDVTLQCDPTVVRLAYGSDPHEGRVEVFYGSTWGKVCDDRWDLYDAEVVCREVGYELGAMEAPRGSHFGNGYGPFLLDDVICEGSEATIFDCEHSGFANDNCYQYNTDAGVVCLTKQTQFRLLGGSTSYEGVVQIWLPELEWSTVCDDNWGHEEQTVLCSQLGYQSYGDLTQDVIVNEIAGSEFSVDFDCSGDEDLLYNDCHWEPVDEGCHPDNVAQISCPTQFRDFEVKLTNGGRGGQGLVWIFHDGIWGTVKLDSRHGEAEVLCRQLGFEDVMDVYEEPVFGTGHGSTIWDMTDVTCFGNEESLGDCWYIERIRESNSTDHSQDASIICKPYESIGNIVVRLVGYDGEEGTKGRVEVQIEPGIWGSVCSSEGWEYKEAKVLCEQYIGTGSWAEVLDPSEFPTGDGLIAFSNMDCYAYGNSLRDCTHGPWGMYDCGHKQDVGVDCYFNRDPGTGSTGIPTWEIVLIALMGAMVFIILTGLALYQRNHHSGSRSTRTHAREHATNSSYEMTEPPPEYRPATPPPTEAPPSYESVLDPPYKENENDIAPVNEVGDHHHYHTSNDAGGIDQSHQLQMPPGLFQMTDSAYI